MPQITETLRIRTEMMDAIRDIRALGDELGENASAIERSSRASARWSRETAQWQKIQVVAQGISAAFSGLSSVIGAIGDSVAKIGELAKAGDEGVAVARKFKSAWGDAATGFDLAMQKASQYRFDQTAMQQILIRLRNLGYDQANVQDLINSTTKISIGLGLDLAKTTEQVVDALEKGGGEALAQLGISKEQYGTLTTIAGMHEAILKVSQEYEGVASGTGAAFFEVETAVKDMVSEIAVGISNSKEMKELVEKIAAFLRDITPDVAKVVKAGLSSISKVISDLLAEGNALERAKDALSAWGTEAEKILGKVGEAADSILSTIDTITIALKYGSGPLGGLAFNAGALRDAYERDFGSKSPAPPKSPVPDPVPGPGPGEPTNLTFLEKIDLSKIKRKIKSPTSGAVAARGGSLGGLSYSGIGGTGDMLGDFTMGTGFGADTGFAAPDLSQLGIGGVDDIEKLSEKMAELANVLKSEVLPAMDQLADEHRWDSVKSGLSSLGDMATTTLRDGMLSSLVDIAAQQQSFGSAMRAMTQSALGELVLYSGKKAITEFAEGMAALGVTWGVHNPSSISHFASFAIFSGIATAGLGGIAGMAASGGGGGSSSGAGAGGGGSIASSAYQPEPASRDRDTSALQGASFVFNIAGSVLSDPVELGRQVKAAVKEAEAKGY